MPGTPPTMSIPHNGGTLNKVALTRRLFLSSMFAYLTALSLLLTLSAVAGLALADPVKNVIAPSVYPVIKAAVTFIYLMFVSQLICVTFWGLYYLGERLHLGDTSRFLNRSATARIEIE
jgi:energy-converting hydrogenase Eha subunit E